MGDPNQMESINNSEVHQNHIEQVHEADNESEFNTAREYSQNAHTKGNEQPTAYHTGNEFDMNTKNTHEIPILEESDINATEETKTVDSNKGDKNSDAKRLTYDKQESIKARQTADAIIVSGGDDLLLQEEKDSNV